MCHQRAVRRLTAAKEKRSWADAQKKRVASALWPELQMSSEDDEDSDKEDSALIVKALPWRSDELTSS